MMSTNFSIATRLGLGIAVAGLCCGTLSALAAQVQRLPRARCTTSTLFASGFEEGETFVGDASAGSGGSGGDSSRIIAVPGFASDPIYGNKTYYLHVPASYNSTVATPLVMVLHGAAGSPAGALSQAQLMRTFWQAASNANGFIVVAPTASGGSGGWIAPASPLDVPSDYDVMLAVVADVEARYNIERQRRYLWGFSAGGHVTLDILLNHFSATLDGDFFAGFGVNAGVTAQLACSGLSGAACNALFANLLPKTPVDVHHGSSDGTVPIAFAQADRTRFVSNGWSEGETYFWQPFSGGHTVLATHPAETWNHLCEFAMLP